MAVLHVQHILRRHRIITPPQRIQISLLWLARTATSATQTPQLQKTQFSTFTLIALEHDQLGRLYPSSFSQYRQSSPRRCGRSAECISKPIHVTAECILCCAIRNIERRLKIHLYAESKIHLYAESKTVAERLRRKKRHNGEYGHRSDSHSTPPPTSHPPRHIEPKLVRTS
ncbi:hypothetical protein GQ42DRAFT_163819 [Ramicandelaber brevisporus]|nr:hypothetical protein GQ42DRAFT_163819 [Ramicandelaber brevisporus]